VHAAEIVEEMENVEENPREVLSPLERGAVDKIMEKMPKDMTEEQRRKVQDLLVKYRSIISTGDHDIGRTDLVIDRYRWQPTYSPAPSPPSFLAP